MSSQLTFAAAAFLVIASALIADAETLRAASTRDGLKESRHLTSEVNTPGIFSGASSHTPDVDGSVGISNRRVQEGCTESLNVENEDPTVGDWEVFMSKGDRCKSDCDCRSRCCVWYWVHFCVDPESWIEKEALQGCMGDAPVADSGETRTFYDAIIVGGGWAGVSAAADLSSSGANVLLLEAKDYIGGRSKTVTDFVPGSSVPFELGSEFVYLEWENHIVDHFNEEEVNYEEVDGQWAVYAPMARNSNGGSKMEDVTADDLMSKLWSNGFVRFVQSQSFKDGADSGYEEMLSKFEAREGITDPLDLQFLELQENSYIVTEYAEDAERVSVKATADWLGAVLSTKMAITSVSGGGYGAAIERFSESSDLGKKIELNSEVTRISYGGDEVEVEFKQNNKVMTARAQTVLVTVPLGVLKTGAITFDPELPEYKRQALSAMECGVLDKLIMYWDKDAMRSASGFAREWDSVMDRDWLELITPETETSGLLTSFFNSGKYNGLYTLTGWIGGTDAKKMERKTDEEVLEEAVSNLRDMLSSDVPVPTRYMITRWGEDEGFRCSYSVPSVGQNFEREAERLGRAVDNKLFFAGEHTCTSGWASTAVGARETGEAAAKNMKKVIG